jgi:hypothetical protein
MRLLRAVLLLFVISQILFLRGASAQDSWPQHRGNSEKTGMGTWRGSVPLTVRILWRVELGSMQGASPIVDGLGNIYVAGIAALGGGHRLAKLNAAGMQQWAVSLGGSTRLRVPPAVRSDGQVVAIAEDSQWFVSVLRPETGRISAISSRFDLPPDRDEFIYRQHLTYSPPTLDRAGNIFIWHRVWQNEVDYGYNLAERTSFPIRCGPLTRTDRSRGETGSGGGSRALRRRSAVEGRTRATTRPYTARDKRRTATIVAVATTAPTTST